VGLRAVQGPCPSGVKSQSPWWIWGLCSQKPTTLLTKLCYFVTVLGMTQRYLHLLPTSVQYEMEEKSVWRQKRVGALPNRLSRLTKELVSKACNVSKHTESEVQTVAR